METESEQTGKKTLIIWGIPIAILVVLVVLLIIELTDDDEISIEPEQVIKEVVIQPTDENTAADTKVQTFFKEEEETPLESEEIATASEFQATETLQETQPADETPLKDEEQEESYIVEEGDSLWKIAKRKDVLGDPWKWKTILIQNKEKINYTIFSQETGQWKVMVEAGKRLIVKPIETSKSISSFDRTRKKRYAVQLMSLDTNQLDKAVDIVKFLIKDGYFAYLYRTRKKIKSRTSAKAQFFFRIRVGFFETEDEALMEGEDIVDQYSDLNIFPPDYWAVLPSYSELNGELIDFGIQRNKPWIIQLAEQSSRKQAIDELKTLTTMVDYLYISQKKNQDGGFMYRTRVGFFETRNDAKKMLAKIQKENLEQFLPAKILELRHVMESALGQATGESSLNKLR